MKKWLQIAKELRVGYSKHVVCPICSAQGDRPSGSINNNIKTWSLYCHKCKHIEIVDKGVLSLQELALQRAAILKAQEPLDLRMPKLVTQSFCPDGRAWLQDCGISDSIATKYGLCQNQETSGIVLPCYDTTTRLTWLQERGVVEGAPKYRQPRAEKQGTWNNCLWKKSRVAVVTEDIASSIRVASATDDNINAHALMGTTINDSQTVLLMKYDYVILWLDDDKAGNDARRAIRPVLSKFTNVRTIITKEDPKKQSNREIQKLIISQLT